MRWAAALLTGFAVLVCGSIGLASSGSPPPAQVTAPPAGASSRVTAHLERASLAEAVTALRKASGQDVRLSGPPAGEPNAPKTATLHWAGVPFGEALRELCQAFQVSCDRRITGYRIVAAAGPSADEFGPPRPGAPAFHARELTVTYQGAEWGSRYRAFRRPADSEREMLTIGLEAATESVDASSIADCVNVAARDDRGNLLTCQEIWPPSPPFRHRGEIYPDRWHAQFTFPFADRRVRKLLSVEGEVFARRTLHTSVSAPFHVGAPVAHRKLLGTDTDVEIYPERTSERGEKQGPSIEIRQELDPAQAGATHQIEAEFVGMSGRTYQPHGSASAGSSDNGRAFRKIDLDFAPIDEPITEVLVGARDQGELYCLAKFRLTNLSVPAAPHLGPDREPVPPARPDPPRGKVSFPVLLGAGPLLGGSLSVGLSQKAGNGWSPVRWRVAVVDEKGLARLEDLVPGTYRITRRFRPEKPLPPGGHWVNETVIATVTGGKPITLPPLQWIPPR